jgi:hypothetical protein
MTLTQKKIPITERYSLQIARSGAQSIVDTLLNVQMLLTICPLTGEKVFDTYDTQLINDIAVHLKYSIDSKGRKIK